MLLLGLACVSGLENKEKSLLNKPPPPPRERLHSPQKEQPRGSGGSTIGVMIDSGRRLLACPM